MLSALKNSRRGKILETAERLFSRQGYRATSMEGLAEQAGMAKATLYSYFSDKDAVFIAVAEQLAERLARGVDSALGSDGDIKSRISGALIAKHEIIENRVRRSNHANELFEARNKMAAEIFETLDDELEVKLAAALQAEGFESQNAKRKARLLFGAAQGIADYNQSFEQTRRDLTILVDALLEIGQ